MHVHVAYTIFVHVLVHAAWPCLYPCPRYDACPRTRCTSMSMSMCMSMSLVHVHVHAAFHVPVHAACTVHATCLFCMSMQRWHTIISFDGNYSIFWCQLQCQNINWHIIITYHRDMPTFKKKVQFFPITCRSMVWWKLNDGATTKSFKQKCRHIL